MAAQEKKSGYVIWGARTPEGAAGLARRGLRGFDDETALKDDKKLAARFPKEVSYEIDPSAGRTTLSDNLKNDDGLVVVSKALKEHMVKLKATNVEYLPVRIVDAKGRLLSKDCYIVHPLRLQYVWDSDRSECEWQNGRVVRVDRLVVDEKSITRPGTIFRLHIVCEPVFVKRSFAESLSATKQGFTGLDWVEIRDFRMDLTSHKPSVADLRDHYLRIRATEDFSVHTSFIRRLLMSNDPDDPEVLDFHFGLLDDKENQDLYHRIRAAFEKRGKAAQDYLVSRLVTEKNTERLADILLLLGLMRSSEAAPLARRTADHTDPELRRRSAVVLGWTGEARDAEVLARLLKDPERKVRNGAATAHQQLFTHLPEAVEALVSNLAAALASEKDEDVLAIIVLGLQTLLDKRFGIRWDSNEGAVSGDVTKAVQKARKALSLRS